ncbi:hypothetical protein N0V86_002726 [Didymella sp. IMI 355093]|nr:hypothetical protein N0V86_002726 [Didymella sp. IMI 355093]
MARATRAKPAPKEPTPEPAPSSIKPLPAPTPNPPKLFVLPKDTSEDARIVTLDDPATSTPSRYYFCPSKGFYEFTRIAAPKKACRSWLITRQDAPNTQGATQEGAEESKDAETEAETGLGSGFITKDASLFLATPIDLLFLILPALAPRSAKEEKQHFLELDDYTDKLAASSHHWRTLLTHHPSLKSMLEKKMRTICDTVDAGDETMYRVSHTKLLAVLMAKAERMVKNGLPPSMEDKFVKTALEIPVMSIRREESTLQHPHLLRLHTALTYLSSTYLPRTLSSALTPLTTPTFTPLTTHLAALARLKNEAAALRSISDNMSRKRGFEIDEDKVAEREEKKRRKEEDALKKKNESLGVKKLRKVDTSGMKKMSAFFSVKPKAK